MIESAIRFLLSNFTLTFLMLGFIAGAISFYAKPKPRTRAQAIKAVFAYFLLFSIAMAYFYNFVMHVFFGELAARFIGWADSPFQTEVGFASLGFSAVGLMAFYGGLGLRAGAVVGPSVFLLGAAGGHIYQMVTVHNFAPGNAGMIFWTDILLPVIGLGLLWAQARETAAGRHAQIQPV